MLCFTIFRPYFHNCRYCDLEYDVVGQLDEYEEDILYMAMRQNLTSKMKELTKATHATTKKNKITNMKILDYMSKVPHEVREKLFELYKIDFEMFGYEYTQFL